MQDYAASGSNSPLWLSAKHGPAHITVINPYTAYGEGSEQMEWLRRDLASVDRWGSGAACCFVKAAAGLNTRQHRLLEPGALNTLCVALPYLILCLLATCRSVTPWVIALFHVPWYSSNSYHNSEGDAHRDSVEQILMDGGVNIVISGHVHSYERWYPSFLGEANKCGITYLNIGDGGNREGLAGDWNKHQPPSSAYREASYGSALLRISSATEALWEWHRNQDGVHAVSDSVIIKRHLSCSNQGVLWRDSVLPSLSTA